DSKEVLFHMSQNAFARVEPVEAVLENGLQMLLSIYVRINILEIDHVVLILHCEYDDIIHPDGSIWICSVFPTAELLMLPHCGHAPFLSCPDQFADAMVRFL